MEKRILSLVMVFILLVSLTSFSYAEASSKLDYVLIELPKSDKIVKVDINDYSNAYLDGEGHSLFDFLRGSMNTPKLYGVVSGDKYIDINVFSNAFLDSDSNLTNAIKNSVGLEMADIAKAGELSELVKGLDGKYSTKPITPIVEEFRVLEIY